ncbi:hypothetical protein D4R87_02435 [bacterium]|nr:MAG: hypothetical protein D4R87_02435 [bacterium]
MNQILNTIQELAGKGLASLGIAGAGLGRMNWASPSWDLFLIILLIGAVFLYGITLGRARIMVIISSIYMSALVAIFFPWNVSWNVLKNVPIKVAVFVVALLFLFVTLTRSGLASIFRASTEGSWIETIIFSVFQIGLITTIVMSFFAQEIIASSFPIMSTIFSGSTAQFVWIVLPILGLIFTKKKREYRSYI